MSVRAAASLYFFCRDFLLSLGSNVIAPKSSDK